MTVRRFLPIMVALGLALLGWCYWTAIADPVVREADEPPGGECLRDGEFHRHRAIIARDELRKKEGGFAEIFAG